MAKYCDVCRQNYSVEHAACPFCDSVNSRPTRTAPAPEDTPLPLPKRENGAPPDAEIDLGAPVGSVGAAADPPSGASFVSWLARIQPRQESSGSTESDSIRISPDSSARILLDLNKPQTNGTAAAKGPRTTSTSDGDIDLGSPVDARNVENGPPSGASFISWTALLREKKLAEAATAAKAEIDAPVTFGSPAEAQQLLDQAAVNTPAPVAVAPQTADGPMTSRFRQLAPWAGIVIISALLAFIGWRLMP